MNDTEKKHFTAFKIPLSLIAASSDALGRTAIISCYAAALWLITLLRTKFKLTDEEVTRAEVIAQEAADI